MNKFCKNCGAKVLGSGLCQNCNTSSTETKSDNNGGFYTNTVLDSTNHITPVGKADLKGLGGWLIFVCLGLIYTLYTAITGAYSNWVMFQDGTVDSLSEISGFSASLGIELFGFVAAVILVSFLLYLFFKKKKDFPKFFIFYVVFLVLFAIIELILINSLGSIESIKSIIQDLNDEAIIILVRSLIFALVWGLYMKKSERVKLTFVE